MSTVDVSRETAVRGIEVAAIGLTLFNAVAAGLVVLLVLLDTHRQRKSWLRISWERRTPLFLGISIIISHVVFSAREFLEYSSVNSQSTEDAIGAALQRCVAANESTWWGVILSRFN
jgi:hypothetical protein